MTKSWEKGENEFTRAAKRLAMRTGESAVDILERLLAEAKQARDTVSCEKIVQAHKYLIRREERKRRRRR